MQNCTSCISYRHDYFYGAPQIFRLHFEIEIFNKLRFELKIDSIIKWGGLLNPLSVYLLSSLNIHLIYIVQIDLVISCTFILRTFNIIFGLPLTSSGA